MLLFMPSIKGDLFHSSTADEMLALGCAPKGLCLCMFGSVVVNYCISVNNSAQLMLNGVNHELRHHCKLPASA